MCSSTVIENELILTLSLISCQSDVFGKRDFDEGVGVLVLAPEVAAGEA